jgi:hypothetical protein
MRTTSRRPPVSSRRFEAPDWATAYAGRSEQLQGFEVCLSKAKSLRRCARHASRRRVSRPSRWLRPPSSPAAQMRQIAGSNDVHTEPAVTPDQLAESAGPESRPSRQHGECSSISTSDPEGVANSGAGM